MQHLCQEHSCFGLKLLLWIKACLTRLMVNMQAARAKLKHDFWSAYLAELTVWPIFQCFNFGMVRYTCRHTCLPDSHSQHALRFKSNHDGHLYNTLIDKLRFHQVPVRHQLLAVNLASLADSVFLTWYACNYYYFPTPSQWPQEALCRSLCHQDLSLRPMQLHNCVRLGAEDDWLASFGLSSARRQASESAASLEEGLTLEEHDEP